MVDMDTLRHSNAREIGTENIAYRKWEKLDLTTLLLSVYGGPGQTCRHTVVSRTRLKDYSYVPGRLTTFMDTRSNRSIRLRAVTTEKNTDCYLEVKSPYKEKKEEEMKLQLEKRFEGELQKINTVLHSK